MKSTVDSPNRPVRDSGPPTTGEGREVDALVATLPAPDLAATESLASVKGTIALPLFDCGPDAPARTMTMGQLLALEQDAQTADDLQRVRASDALAGELSAIGKDCARRLDASTRELDHGDWLYDDKGVPR